MNVFADLDGTVVCSEMHHTSWWLIRSLPNATWRILRSLQFLLSLPLVGICSLVSESLVIRLLTFISLGGLKEDDVAFAARNGVLPRLMQSIHTS